MAKAKSTARSRSSFSQEKYTAELSPGQLVIGVAILLVFGLACFLLGILIGKFDPSLQTAENVQSSPTTQTKMAVVEQPAPKETPPPVKMETRKEPKADPPPAAKTTTQVAKTNPSSALPQAKPVIEKKPPTEKPKPPVEKPKPPIVKTETKPVVKPPEKAPIPAPITKKPAVVGAQWTVQVASFRLETNAKKEQTRLEAKSPHKVDLLSKDARGYFRLAVGTFSDKAKAEKLEKELLTQYKFPTTWVAKRN
jgi:hypothetical protein